ncbi:MAG TPA: SRPBCC domain-containing protein [Candidatus Limnocylindria bacterium]|nr:SRPBCC domain-containing protein [Candidatus Limnocylindria bacterium]
MTTVKTTTGSRTSANRPRARRYRRLLAALAAIGVILAGYSAWTNTQPYTLQASIRIHATPQRVWAVLTGLAAYPRWNPFIINSRGHLKPGATLVNQMRDATGTTTFTPTVEVVQAGRELRWIGRVGPGGIFDGEHTFTIRQLRPGLVLLTQREDFTGIAVPFYKHHLAADTLPQFRAMNAALARQAELRP